MAAPYQYLPLAQIVTWGRLHHRTLEVQEFLAIVGDSKLEARVGYMKACLKKKKIRKVYG